MKVIVGLGNPGKRYNFHRHNIGSRVVQWIAEKRGREFKRKDLLKAEVASILKGDIPVWLVKPLTFMNLSGECVARILERMEVFPCDFLIVYDDVALPLGKLRFRTEGGSGGHKGMDSILGTLGTQKVNRLRIGIGRPRDPSADLVQYVLSNFTPEEEEIISPVIDRAADCCWEWVGADVGEIMQKYNS